MSKDEKKIESDLFFTLMPTKLYICFFFSLFLRRSNFPIIVRLNIYRFISIYYMLFCFSIFLLLLCAQVEAHRFNYLEVQMIYNTICVWQCLAISFFSFIIHRLFIHFVSIFFIEFEFRSESVRVTVSFFFAIVSLYCFPLFAVTRLMQNGFSLVFFFCAKYTSNELNDSNRNILSLTHTKKNNNYTFEFQCQNNHILTNENALRNYGRSFFSRLLFFFVWLLRFYIMWRRFFLVLDFNSYFCLHNQSERTA